MFLVFQDLSNAHNHAFIIAAIDFQNFCPEICTTELIIRIKLKILKSKNLLSFTFYMEEFRSLR